MELTYDPKYNIAYIRFREKYGEVEAIKLSDDFVVDIASDGAICGIELFNAKDEEEFTSKGPWDLSPERQPDGQLSSEKAKKMIEKAMNEGSAFFEWTHKTLDGKEFSTTVLLTRVEIEKGKPFLQATVRDITGQKKMREWYRILFNYSPDAIMLLSEDKEILSVNPSMARSLGISADDLIGRNLCDILPKDVDEKRTAIARKALETGEIQENEDERDGRFFHNIFVPIFTANVRVQRTRPRSGRGPSTLTLEFRKCCI